MHLSVLLNIKTEINQQSRAPSVRVFVCASFQTFHVWLPSACASSAEISFYRKGVTNISEIFQNELRYNANARRFQMLQTVKAEVDESGTVHLLEPLRVEKRTRAIVTLLDEPAPVQENKGNAKKIIELMQSPEFKNRKSYSAEEIEAQIEENRNSWD
jgi:hypothetical protein